jgi:CubicO group peptidase (beta-lactamase class C family)
MDSYDVEVHGQVDPAFKPLVHIFARAVGMQLTGGAQLAVYHRGRKVADLTGGDFADDAVMLVFSVSKGVAAIATHHAIAAGRLSIRLPLHEVWPEFGRSETTRRITLEHVLTHSAGLPSVERVLSMDDHIDGALEREVARQDPYWEPGSAHGYHSLTWGALLDGVFRRALGVTVGGYVAEHAVAPLRLDLSFGATEEQLPRVRPYFRPARATMPLERRLASEPGDGPDGAGQLLSDLTQFNRTDALRCGWPASNVVSSARDLARYFAAAIGEVDGLRLLEADQLAELTRPRYEGVDRVLGFPIAFGAGVQLPFSQFPMLGPGSFGHEGAGGHLAVADPTRELTVAYLSDRFPTSNGASVEGQSLVAAAGMIVDRL